MCSNIPASPAYGVYISQLIRYMQGPVAIILDISMEEILQI
jgi:hypothetical protein